MSIPYDHDYDEQDDEPVLNAQERKAMTAAVMAEQDEVEVELERIHSQLASLAADVHRLVQVTPRGRSNGGGMPVAVGPEPRPEEPSRS